MTAAPATGLHHVTCVCDRWTPTVAFYEAMGFHLVKNTVNHDAPKSRHIYLADAQGAPGTTITFFEWPNPRRGAPGLQSAQHVGLDLAPGLDLETVAGRLTELDRPAQIVDDRERRCLETTDPDGLRLRLREAREGAQGPRLGHVALYGAVDQRASFFEAFFGLKPRTDGPGPTELVAPDGTTPLLLIPGDPGPGRIAPGAVHHVALGAKSLEHQAALRERLVQAGHQATDPIDRIYFTSVYTRDPGGHIIELATPEPGFTADEPADELGQHLVLPDWLEDQRAEIEAALGD